MGKAKADTGDERRRSPRAPVVLRVDYSTVDSFFSEFTSDINDGGMFIDSDQPAALGTKVSLYFALPGSDDPVKVEGSVVWVRGPGDEEPSGMGVEFDELDAFTRHQINEVVRRLRVS